MRETKLKMLFIAAISLTACGDTTEEQDAGKPHPATDPSREEVSPKSGMLGLWASSEDAKVLFRFTEENFIIRFRKESGSLGMLDSQGEDTIVLKTVTDPDGKEYFEIHSTYTINSQTTPWEIDTVEIKKDGSERRKKGICELQGGNLRLELKEGDIRPSKFKEGKPLKRVPEAKP